MPHTVYLAAALFAGRETSWNAALAAGLEAARHRVHLPQRDGFEFAELQQHLPTDSQVDQAKL
ncbi:MAG: hypothetical protein PF961_17610, partial [Planctomycetota bacterium]|nr:hypothetical protein [Planctomycetota bacterium]